MIPYYFNVLTQLRLPDCKGFVPIRMTCMCRVKDGVLEARAQLDVAPVSRKLLMQTPSRFHCDCALM